MVDRIEISKTYVPSEIEGPIYKLWLKSNAFHAKPNGRGRQQRYVIMMPLPNVTGALHMGHAMDNVMQDLLIRWHRMMNHNTLWMPGTDHAGIATQAVVEKRLKELEGLTRHDIGREGLIQRIWEWKDQYQARIIEQQQRMGCSCDWQRQRFTMDKVCARAVRHAFFRMFLDGLIYRGKRLVNWDTYLRTSISDDEVYHETVKGYFWHLRYPVINPKPGEPEYVVVATTRPETMLGDTAVAVHPNPDIVLADRIKELELALNTATEKERSAINAELTSLKDRQKNLLPKLLKLKEMAEQGRMVNLPLLDRHIPLICDEWAKPELGSGCVKITPAHDPNDYDVWQRHKNRIGIINILNPDGTLNENAGPYKNMDRFEAREKVVEDLKKLGLMEMIEDHEVEIGHSDRSKTPIEPYLSDQWFIDMGDIQDGIIMGRGTQKEYRSHGLVQAAIDAVNSNRVQIHPARYTKTYLDWLSQKRDWPISRQLWWGHQIPVWSQELAWNKIKSADLKSILSSNAVVRVRIEGEEKSHLLVAPCDYKQSTPTAIDVSFQIQPGSSCRVDVCLLEDDPEQIRRLEELGFERDPDVLDTWFSSALWPFSTLGWPDPETAEVEPGQAILGSSEGYPDCLDYYYPGSCLVTGRDIITLWVARMVIMGLYCLGDVPFSDVFIHANILDGKGERMSKSKGNGIDPVDIIDTYGTDAMRFVLCDMQTGTQDIRLPVTAICPVCNHHNDLANTPHGKSIFTYICGSCKSEFDVLGTMPELPSAKLISERFEEGRAFCTKLWNSARFAFMNLEDVPAGDLNYEQLSLEDRWILDELNRTVQAVTTGLADYNPSAALNAAKEFFWGALCDWYLELIKSRVQNTDASSASIARWILAFCLDTVLRLFHPFVPFITEHLWQQLNCQVPHRNLGNIAQALPSEYLIQAAWPEPNIALANEKARSEFILMQNITRAIREIRSAQNIPPKQLIDVTFKLPSEEIPDFKKHLYIAVRLCGISNCIIDPAAKRKPGDASKIVENIQLFIHNIIDDEAERLRLTKAINKVEKEIATCSKQLANPKFIERAPAEVIEEQKRRLQSYQDQLNNYQSALKALE